MMLLLVSIVGLVGVTLALWGYVRWRLRTLAADPVYLRACALVKRAELLATGTSGEYKRHWVLAHLRKAFPQVPTRDLAMMIERAVGRVLR